jgi:hypothetical protein
MVGTVRAQRSRLLMVLRLRTFAHPTDSRSIAQLEEHGFPKAGVAGSSPARTPRDGEPARLAGAALNTDGAARHGLRMLRHPPIHGRSTDRAIGIAWKAIGWFATADRDRGLPPQQPPPFIPPPLAGEGRVGAHGCLTRAASGTRSKRDGTSRCGDRHVRHPPFQHSADRGSNGSKRGS